MKRDKNLEAMDTELKDSGIQKPSARQAAREYMISSG